jgi:hypothetical protein
MKSPRGVSRAVVHVAYTLACVVALSTGGPGYAHAEPQTATQPDAPPRRGPPTVGTGSLRPAWDLDGTYLWLGPTGAASFVDDTWDSTFGGQLAIVRVRERAALGAIGGALGASMWTERDGGRIWLDAIVGSRVGGQMLGATIGPLLELSQLQHPRLGASLGVWAFLGVTPYARVGYLDELGGFAEVGVHLALPVFRR